MFPFNTAKTKKNTNSQRQANRLSMEGLEDRRMMAGISIGSDLSSSCCDTIDGLDTVAPPILHVNTTDDIVDTDPTTTSLREAIMLANKDSNVVEIVLPDLSAASSRTYYYLSQVGSGPDERYGDLDILANPQRSGQLVIRSEGEAEIHAVVGLGDRVMEVHADVIVMLDNVSISGGAVWGNGGGIYNAGTLTLSGGAVGGNDAVGNAESGSGGGIYNLGTVTLNNTSVLHNDAGMYGGGITNYYDGSVTLNSSSVQHNDAGWYGGGIDNFGGTVTLNNTSVLHNHAGRFGGGGISIFRGTVMLNSSSVQHNDAGQHGGGIRNISGTVTLNSSSVQHNDAGEYGGGIYQREGTLRLENDSSITGNRADSYGGGIHNQRGELTIDDSSLTNNHAVSAGGIFNGGWANLVDSVFNDNYAFTDGGAIYNTGTLEVTNSRSTPQTRSEMRGNQADGRGGGIYVGAGTVTVDSTTIDDNTAHDHGGGIFANDGETRIVASTISNNRSELDGGGLYAGNGHIHLVNSTVSTNHSGGAGGGIYNGADLTVTNSTVAYNDAVNGGGGFGIFNAAAARLFNTIVAHNFHTTNSYLDDLGGKLPDAVSSHNLIGENLKDVNDLRLGALANNGGPTWTHELREGSIAIDAGDNNLAKSFDGTDLTEDQIGRDRIITGGGNGPLTVDVGAFEYIPWN